MKSIIRFKGGCGGDTIIKLILDSYPGIESNVEFVALTDSARSEVANKGSAINIGLMTNEDVSNILNDSLIAELDQLILAEKHFVIKSHYYGDLKSHNKYILDIVADKHSLPFVVSANIAKTDTIAKANFNAVTKKINDADLLFKYTSFCIAKDSLSNDTPKKNNVVEVSAILSGWDSLQDSLKAFDIHLAPNTRSYYEAWLQKNVQYLPSEKYRNYINESNYNFYDTNLSETEQYCLLALSGNKFKIKI